STKIPSQFYPLYTYNIITLIRSKLTIKLATPNIKCPHGDPIRVHPEPQDNRKPRSLQRQSTRKTMAELPLGPRPPNAPTASPLHFSTPPLRPLHRQCAWT